MNSRDIPIKDFLVLGVAILLYSMIVYDFADGGSWGEQTWQWLSTITATVLAVLFGIVLFRYRTELEEDRKIYRICQALDAELEQILCRIDASECLYVRYFYLLLPSKKRIILILSLAEDQALSLEEGVKSGLLKRADLAAFSQVSHQLRAYEKACDQFVSLYQLVVSQGASPNKRQEEALLEAERVVENSHDGAVYSCKLLRKDLERWFKENEHAKPPNQEPL